MKIKTIRYEKLKPKCILFKYNYSDLNYRVLCVSGRGRTGSDNVIPATIGKLYSNQLPISGLKKENLLKLCSEEAIPVEFHAWYRSIPAENSKKDVAPEPSLWSDSEEFD